MAFSHRPTWHAARGGGSTFDIKNYVTGGMPSRHIHTQDLPNHAFIKYRQPTQGTKEEIATRDLQAELRLKEQVHFTKQGKVPSNYGPLLKDNQGPSLALEDAVKSKEGKIDFSQFDDSDDEVSSDTESDSDSDDDEAELMRELARIRHEKEQEKKRIEEQEASLAAKGREIERLREMNSKVKRRWNEDIVFRNQAASEPKQKKRFINDTIRNDFHRNFLNKYIK